MEELLQRAEEYRMLLIVRELMLAEEKSAGRTTTASRFI
jgi:hypothetical protein